MSNIVYLLWPVFHHLVDAVIVAAISGGKHAVHCALQAPYLTDGLVLPCITAILPVKLAGAVDGDRGVGVGELLVA